MPGDSLPLGPLHRGAAGPAANRLAPDSVAPDSVVKEPDGSGGPHELRLEPHSLLFEPRSRSFAGLKAAFKPHSFAFASRSLRFGRCERLSPPHSPFFAAHEAWGMPHSLLLAPLVLSFEPRSPHFAGLKVAFSLIPPPSRPVPSASDDAKGSRCFIPPSSRPAKSGECLIPSPSCLPKRGERHPSSSSRHAHNRECHAKSGERRPKSGECLIPSSSHLIPPRECGSISREYASKRTSGEPKPLSRQAKST
jgi:hypothetical protein